MNYKNTVNIVDLCLYASTLLILHVFCNFFVILIKIIMLFLYLLNYETIKYL